MIKIGLGQDSHRFDFKAKEKTLTLAGIKIPDTFPLQGNSDADVVLHAITNAFSSVSCVPILGKKADELCLEQGITDSKFYLREALKYLKGYSINHLAISIECSYPKLLDQFPKMRASIAKILGIDIKNIGICATSGEGLSEFGKGQGIQVFCIATLEAI